MKLQRYHRYLLEQGLSHSTAEIYRARVSGILTRIGAWEDWSATEHEALVLGALDDLSSSSRVAALPAWRWFTRFSREQGVPVAGIPDARHGRVAKSSDARVPYNVGLLWRKLYSTLLSAGLAPTDMAWGDVLFFGSTVAVKGHGLTDAATRAAGRELHTWATHECERRGSTLQPHAPLDPVGLLAWLDAAAPVPMQGTAGEPTRSAPPTADRAAPPPRPTGFPG